jgi:(p)ppGpp synthase/HD superfamily hydrolase
MNNIALEEGSLSFAQNRFIDNNVTRKYTGEPYINHCIEVANYVRNADGSSEMIAASLLHDTVEDTPTTIGEIYKEFGAEVGFYVQCMTDVAVKEDGNRATRKRIERMRLSMAPRNVKTIKLADMLSNGKDIVKHDSRFAKTYMAELSELLPYLEMGDTNLWNKCRFMLEEYYGD